MLAEFAPQAGLLPGARAVPAKHYRLFSRGLRPAGVAARTMVPIRHTNQGQTMANAAIRLQIQVDLAYDIRDPAGADFVFNIHAAHTSHQTVENERLVLSQPVEPDIATEPATSTRFMRLHANPGPLHLTYKATVCIAHHREDPAALGEVPVRCIPLEVLPYIYPSRYCQSDRLMQLAFRNFGQLAPGYSRVLAIQQWVQELVTFASATSNSSTSAVDTLVEQVGVCRDFTHLMIALCRALNIPARLATGTAGFPCLRGSLPGRKVVSVRCIGHGHSHGLHALWHGPGRGRRGLCHHLRQRGGHGPHDPDTGPGRRAQPAAPTVQRGAVDHRAFARRAVGLRIVWQHGGPKELQAAACLSCLRCERRTAAALRSGAFPSPQRCAAGRRSSRRVPGTA